MGMAAACLAQHPKVSGSSTPYRQEEYDKMLKMEYDVKSLDGYSKEFKTSSIEMKAATLPEYGGNLKSVPLTEWQSSKADFYTKSLSLHDFEIKQALDKWSQPAMFSTETAVSMKNSSMDGRPSEDSSKTFDKKDLPPPYAVKNEDLQNLINYGSEAPAIKVGNRFSSTEIKGTPKKDAGKK